jgi:hypothetical protein
VGPRIELAIAVRSCPTFAKTVVAVWIYSAFAIEERDVTATRLDSLAAVEDPAGDATPRKLVRAEKAGRSRPYDHHPCRETNFAGMWKRPVLGRRWRAHSKQNLNVSTLPARIDGAAQNVKLWHLVRCYPELLGSELTHRLAALRFIECESKLESDVGGHDVLTADSIRAKDGCRETFQP